MPVDDCDRPQCAGAQAIHCFERKFAVGSRFAGTNAEGSREFFRDYGSPPDVACRPQTHQTNVLASWLQAKGAEEGGHAVDIRERPSGPIRHDGEGIGRKIAVPRLDLLKDADKSAELPSIFLDNP